MREERAEKRDGMYAPCPVLLCATPPPTTLLMVSRRGALRPGHLGGCVVVERVRCAEGRLAQIRALRFHYADCGPPGVVRPLALSLSVHPKARFKLLILCPAHMLYRYYTATKQGYVNPDCLKVRFSCNCDVTPTERRSGAAAAAFYPNLSVRV